VACQARRRCALARANRVFCTDKKRIRTENTVMDKINSGLWVGFIQDRRLRADVLFIRAQSTIRADGFSSAQNRNFSATAATIYTATNECVTLPQPVS
jgi:hypothetical protein